MEERTNLKREARKGGKAGLGGERGQAYGLEDKRS